MNTNPSCLHDPKLTVYLHPFEDRAERLPHQTLQKRETRVSTGTKDNDTGTGARRKTKYISKVHIKTDQTSVLVPTRFVELTIRCSLKPFIAAVVEPRGLLPGKDAVYVRRNPRQA